MFGCSVAWPVVREFVFWGGVVVWCWCVCRFVVLLYCRCVDWSGRCYGVLLLSYLFACVIDGEIACLVVCFRSCLFVCVFV